MNKFIQYSQGKPPEKRIFRAAHSKTCPYVKTAKAAVDDDSLQLAALGLLTVLLSKPDHWRIDPSRIARERGIGIVQVRRLLAMLVTAGYLVAPQRRRNAETGRFEYTDFYLLELPVLADTVLRKPIDGEPPAADHETDDSQNQAQNPTIKESIAITDSLTTDSNKKHHQIDGHDDDVFTDSETGEFFLTQDIPEHPAATGVKEGDGQDTSPVASPPPVPAAPSPAAALLVAHGVTEPALSQAVSVYTESEIVAAIAHMTAQQKKVHNPAGWLIDCLREDWYKKPDLSVKPDVPQHEFNDFPQFLAQQGGVGESAPAGHSVSDDAWNLAMSQLSLKLDRTNLSVLQNARLVSIDGDVYTLIVNNAYAQRVISAMSRNILADLNPCRNTPAVLKVTLEESSANVC